MACGKPPYVSGDKSDNIHKTKASQISLRGFVVTRTGIENLGALFVTCRDMQKSPKIRHFRTIHKNSFTLFLAKFLHP